MTHLTKYCTLSLILSVTCLTADLATAQNLRVKSRALIPKAYFLGEITGTVDPQQDSCTGMGVPVPPSFTNLTSITSGGTVINVVPGLGTQLGEVYRLGPNQFAAGFFGYLPTPFGLLNLEVQSTVDYATDTGIFLTLLTAPDGSPICEYGGSLSATRLSGKAYPGTD